MGKGLNVPPVFKDVPVTYVTSHLGIAAELQGHASHADELAYWRGWNDAFAMFLGDMMNERVNFIIKAYADKFIDFRTEDQVEKMFDEDKDF